MTVHRDRREAGLYEPKDQADGGLDSMRKADLIAYATANGIEVSSDWTKDEIREAIDEAGG